MVNCGQRCFFAPEQSVCTYTLIQTSTALCSVLSAFQVGSAAMLGGISRLCIALTVILVECTGKYSGGGGGLIVSGVSLAYL